MFTIQSFELYPIKVKKNQNKKPDHNGHVKIFKIKLLQLKIKR